VISVRFRNAMDKFTIMEFLEPHQRNARVHLQEPSSLERAHSCEVWEEVGFLTIGSIGELSFLETTFLRDSMPSYL
jgi:hypothetical protein